MDQKKRRSSILKKTTRYEAASPTQTFTKSSRRISFSGTKSVKEFIAGEDKATIWGTSYEEEDGIHAGAAASKDSIENAACNEIRNISMVARRNRLFARNTVSESDKENFIMDITSDSMDLDNTQNFALSYDNRTFTNTFDISLNSFEIKNLKFKREALAILAVESKNVDNSEMSVVDTSPRLERCHKVFSNDGVISDKDRSMLQRTAKMQKNRQADNVNMLQQFEDRIDQLGFEDCPTEASNNIEEVSKIVNNPQQKCKTLIFADENINIEDKLNHRQVLNSQQQTPMELKSQLSAALTEDFARISMVKSSKGRSSLHFSHGEQIDINARGKVGFDPKQMNVAFEHPERNTTHNHRTIIFEGGETVDMAELGGKHTKMKGNENSQDISMDHMNNIVIKSSDKTLSEINESIQLQRTVLGGKRQTCVFDNQDVEVEMETHNKFSIQGSLIQPSCSLSNENEKNKRRQLSLSTRRQTCVFNNDAIDVETAIEKYRNSSMNIRQKDLTLVKPECMEAEDTGKLTDLKHDPVPVNEYNEAMSICIRECPTKSCRQTLLFHGQGNIVTDLDKVLDIAGNMQASFTDSKQERTTKDRKTIIFEKGETVDTADSTKVSRNAQSGAASSEINATKPSKTKKRRTVVFDNEDIEVEMEIEQCVDNLEKRLLVSHKSQLDRTLNIVEDISLGVKHHQIEDNRESILNAFQQSAQSPLNAISSQQIGFDNIDLRVLERERKQMNVSFEHPERNTTHNHRTIIFEGDETVNMAELGGKHTKMKGNENSQEISMDHMNNIVIKSSDKTLSEINESIQLQRTVLGGKRQTCVFDNQDVEVEMETHNKFSIQGSLIQPSCSLSNENEKNKRRQLSLSTRRQACVFNNDAIDVETAIEKDRNSSMNIRQKDLTLVKPECMEEKSICIERAVTTNGLQLKQNTASAESLNSKFLENMQPNYTDNNKENFLLNDDTIEDETEVIKDDEPTSNRFTDRPTSIPAPERISKNPQTKIRQHEIVTQKTEKQTNSTPLPGLHNDTHKTNIFTNHPINISSTAEDTRKLTDLKHDPVPLNEYNEAMSICIRECPTKSCRQTLLFHGQGNIATDLDKVLDIVGNMQASFTDSKQERTTKDRKTIIFEKGETVDTADSTKVSRNAQSGTASSEINATKPSKTKKRRTVVFDNEDIEVEMEIEQCVDNLEKRLLVSHKSQLDRTLNTVEDISLGVKHHQIEDNRESILNAFQQSAQSPLNAISSQQIGFDNIDLRERERLISPDLDDMPPVLDETYKSIGTRQNAKSGYQTLQRKSAQAPVEETILVNRDKYNTPAESHNASQASGKARFENNSWTTTNIHARLLKKYTPDSIYLSQTARCPMIAGSFHTTGSSSSFSPNTTDALCNLNPSPTAGARCSFDKNRETDESFYQNFKRDYAELTIDATRSSPFGIDDDDDDNIEKTHIDLIDTISIHSIPDTPEKIEVCEASVAFQIFEANEPTVDLKNITLSEHQRQSLCRKCKNCQRAMLNDSTLAEFNLEEPAGIVQLNFDALNKLKGKPRIQDVLNEFKERRLSSCFNSTYEESILQPSAPSVEFLLRNYEECYRQSLEEESQSENYMGAVFPLIPSFEFLFLNRIKTTKSGWIFNMINLPIGVLECRHRIVKSIRLMVHFDSDDLYTPHCSRLDFSKVLLEKCKMYKNPTVFDRIVLNEIYLRVPGDLTAFCSSSIDLFEFLNNINGICERSHELTKALLKVIYSHCSSLYYDESENCIVKRTVCMNQTSAKQQRMEFRILIWNIEKMSSTDILLPSRSYFNDSLRSLPAGLEFLEKFLSNPVNFLKQNS